MTISLGAEPVIADHDPALIEDAGNHPGDESRGVLGFALTENGRLIAVVEVVPDEVSRLTVKRSAVTDLGVRIPGRKEAQEIGPESHESVDPSDQE